MFVKQMSAVAAEEVKAGTKTTRQVLISPSEGPNFAMRKIHNRAGRGNAYAHKHS